MNACQPLLVEFVGRERELAALEGLLARVRQTGRGILLAVRGRRQVGKSRLLEEFVSRSGVPHAFFAATLGASPASEFAEWSREIGSSSFEAAELFATARFEGWEPGLRALARSVTRPSIAVIDELPYLLSGAPVVEGALQTAWDRHLSKVPILLVLVGSDVSIMEALGSHGRPLFQRVREMVIEPLSVGEVGSALGLGAAQAFDAYLICGGFPRIVGEWRRGASVAQFLDEQLADSTSPLVVVGERVLNAEFPTGAQARDVLVAIGSGETTFTRIRDRTGLNEGSLSRSLTLLSREKRVVAVDRPLSAERSKLVLYRVAEPYLRFWLRFVRPNLELLLRGRGEDVRESILRAWPDYRGRAVEPVVRGCVERLLPDARFGGARFVGSYWTRQGDVQVDLVGAGRHEAPADVAFVGSIKWRERAPFGRSDLLDLAAARRTVPGAEQARIVAVSRSGFAAGELDVALEPGDLR